MPHPLLSTVDALLIDLDGTLVDSSAPVARVWSAFAHRHRLDPDTVLRYAQGRPSRETVAALTPPHRHAEEAAIVEHAEVHDTAGVIALPGADAILHYGQPLAIVTSCSTALATARLTAAGLPIPQLLVSSDGLHRGKPDPECFLLAAAHLDVRPSRCLVLEDAPAGIAAGRAAGAKIIALRTTHSDHELRDADAIVDNLDTLLSTPSQAP